VFVLFMATVTEAVGRYQWHFSDRIVPDRREFNTCETGAFSNTIAERVIQECVQKENKLDVVEGRPSI